MTTTESYAVLTALLLTGVAIGLALGFVLWGRR